MLWSIVNAIGSQAMRIADGCISMQTGPEIGVASTKAFTAPLIDLYLLAVYLGDLRGTLTPEKRFELVQDLMGVPAWVGQCLEREHEIVRLARKFKNTSHMLYLGRGLTCRSPMKVRSS